MNREFSLPSYKTTNFPSTPSPTLAVWLPLILALFFPISCSGGGGEDLESSRKKELAKLQKKSSQQRKLVETRLEVEAFLKKVDTPNLRREGESLLTKIKSNLEQTQLQAYNQLTQNVDQLLQEGQLEGAVNRLKDFDPILKNSKYLEKIVGRIKELQSRKGVYIYGFDLMKKAREYSQSRKYDIALTVLDAFEVVEGKKPQELLNKINQLRREIDDRRNGKSSSSPGTGDDPPLPAVKLDATWKPLVPRTGNLNSADAMQLRPGSPSNWKLTAGVLNGRGSGEGANMSQLWIAEIPRGPEMNQVKNFRCYFEVKVVRGRGLDFIIRNSDTPYKVKTYFVLSSDKFKPQKWYQVQGKIEGNKASLSCPANRFQQNTPTSPNSGVLGFMIYKDSEVQIRNVRIKVLD